MKFVLQLRKLRLKSCSDCPLTIEYTETALSARCLPSSTFSGERLEVFLSFKAHDT